MKKFIPITLKTDADGPKNCETFVDVATIVEVRPLMGKNNPAIVSPNSVVSFVCIGSMVFTNYGAEIPCVHKPEIVLNLINTVQS